MGYSRKKTNKMDGVGVRHGISKGIEEKACGISTGLIKKEAESLRVVKRKTCWISSDLNFCPWIFHEV